MFGFGRNCLWPDCSNDSWLTPSFCSVRNCEPHCYRPQQSCEGYVFTPVCHSVHRGVCLSACWHTTIPPQSRHPPGADTPLEQTPAGPGAPLGADTPRSRPPGTGHPPGPGTPPGADTPPRNQAPPSRRLLLRTVRILLECILVRYQTVILMFCSQFKISSPFIKCNRERDWFNQLIADLIGHSE